MDKKRAVLKMVEESKRKKQRYRDERDKLMGKYHQIRSYLNRVKHPLIGETTDALPFEIDAAVLRELQRRLQQLPGCVQDDHVVEARTNLSSMIQESILWVQKAYRDLKVVNVAHQYKYYHHLLKLMNGTGRSRGVAVSHVLQRMIQSKYEKCQKMLQQHNASGLSSMSKSKSKSTSKLKSSTKKRKRRRASSVAESAKRRRAREAGDNHGMDVEEEESSEEESSEEEISSSEEGEEEDMELLSPA